MAFVRVDCPQDLKALMNQIFNDGFMKVHTRFKSFESFRYSSAVFINWDSGELIYDEQVFDNFVQECTHFHSWDEMVRTAVDSCFSS